MVDGRGIRNDRRWMLVDEDGVFLLQRELPRLELVRVGIGGDEPLVNTSGMPILNVPFEPEGEAGTGAVMG